MSHAEAPGRDGEGQVPEFAYVVSRFPHVTETFIVRELDAVRARGLALHVRALFPRADSTDSAAAQPWMPGLRRPSPREAASAVAWWLARRPVTLARCGVELVAGHRRSPRVLVRALVTVPLAAAHARDLVGSGVVHVHAHYATYPALAAWVCRRLTGVGYSFTVHAHDLYVDQSMLATKIREASFVSTVSHHNRALLEAVGSTGEARVVVVRCGVPVAAIPFEPRLPPEDGTVQALCVASLQEYKGHRHLLAALRDERLRRVSLHLVGAGPLRADLQDLAVRLGVGERVRFHGALPEERVAELLRRAHLFVLPSVVARDGQMEGVPVALMEAMAHGVPVVATRLSGIPELVTDDAEGLLAEPASPSSLADAVSRVLGDPGATEGRIRRAREKVEREFDIEGSGAAMAALLREAASGRGRSGPRVPRTTRRARRGVSPTATSA